MGYFPADSGSLKFTHSLRNGEVSYRKPVLIVGISNIDVL